MINHFSVQVKSTEIDQSDGEKSLKKHEENELKMQDIVTLSIIYSLSESESLEQQVRRMLVSPQPTSSDHFLKAVLVTICYGRDLHAMQHHRQYY